MSEHVEVHAPHELSETERYGAVSRQERVLEIVAVLLLSFSTLCIAWTGFQAAKWGVAETHHYSEADSFLVLANRANTKAGQDGIRDELNFNRWLDASTNGNQTLADSYRRRFRPEFVIAFNAWLAQTNDPKAIASPLLMPQYEHPEHAKANALDKRSEAAALAADHAGETSNEYIFATVFFAAVLFFAGISMRFRWVPMRITVLILSGFVLVYGIYRLVDLRRL
jgi:hypothetical protein